MVIPVHDANPVRRRPVVTYLLIAVNVVVFLFEPASGLTTSAQSAAAKACHEQAFFDRYAAIPEEITSGRQLQTPVPTGEVGVDRSSGQVGCVVAPASYQKSPWASIFFAMFLHGGWLHLLGNMLFLWVFGNNVEDRFRRLPYLAFYLASGVVATYGFALADPHSTATLVGASGAIAGVLGAYLVLFPRARVTSLVPFFFFIPLRLPAWLVLGSWFLLQWLYTQGGQVGASGVAYAAHVVGFGFGALVALLLRRWLLRGLPPGYPQRPPVRAWRA